MLGPAGLGALARVQLAAWQQIASAWPLYLDAAEGHMRCCACTQSVARLTDDAHKAFSYTAGDWLALLVAHLRQAHPDMDPDR